MESNLDVIVQPLDSWTLFFSSQIGLLIQHTHFQHHLHPTSSTCRPLAFSVFIIIIACGASSKMFLFSLNFIFFFFFIFCFSFEPQMFGSVQLTSSRRGSEPRCWRCRWRDDWSYIYSSRTVISGIWAVTFFHMVWVCGIYKDAANWPIQMIKQVPVDQ